MFLFFKFMDELQKIANNADVKVAEKIFNNSGSSDYIVVFLRFVFGLFNDTSNSIKRKINQDEKIKFSD